MAIIYSYPTVPPTADDLVLGTDVNQPDKPTKNFTIQSIVDIVAGGAAGLGAVLKISSNAQDLTDPSNPVNQPIQNLTFINGTGSATFGSFTDGSMTISSGVGVNFTSITSVDFLGNLTGIVKVGSSIAGASDGNTSNNVTAVTQPTGTNNTTIATTAFVQQEITGEDLDFRGDSTTVTGSVDLNSEKLAIVGKTVGGIKNINTDTTSGGTLLNLSLANSVTIADDLTVTDVLTVNGVTASNIIEGGLQVNNSGGTHAFRVKGQTNDNLINTNFGSSDADDKVAIGKNTADAGTRLDVDGLIQGGTIKSTGLLTANTDLWFKDKIGLAGGGTPNYGSTGNVLTSGGASGDATWTDITTWGYVESVAAGKGIVLSGTAVDPIVNIDYEGADNAILEATTQNTIAPAADFVWFSDTSSASGTISKTLIENLPFIPEVTGTQYTLPMFATTTTLGDSIIKQNAGATEATITGTLDVTSTATASKFIVDATKVDANFRGVASQAKALEIAGDISSVNDVISYPATSGTTKAQSGTGVAVEFQDGAGENNSIIYPVIGQVVTVGSGTGVIPVGTTVASVSGSTFTLSVATTTALAAGDTLNFAASTLDIYTSGGNVRMPSFIPSTVATSKYLTNLPTPTSSAITANDTILAAMAKLQGQITSTTGLAYEGTWDARNSAEGGSSDGGNPDLTQASTKVNGHFYIVSTAGNAEPNGGGGTQLSPWAVGDWCIYVSNGSSTDEWQKLDQSNEVLGSGAANKIARWTSTNTLGTGLISDDASTVTIGSTGTGDFLVEGGTTLGGGATNNTLVSGDLRVNKDFNLVEALGVWDGSAFNYGPISGTTKRVLTSGGAAGTPPTWEVPTVGVVTSITGDYGITVGGTAAVPTIAVTADTNNLINQATAKATPVGADTILINDSAASNVLKKATLTSIKTFTAENWILSDGSNTTTISDGDSATFAGGTYITTGESSGTLTITHDATSRTDTTSTDGPAFGGTFEAVTSVTSNATGHVTAIDVSTITIPSLPTLDNYQYWTLSDGTTTVNISSTNTAKVVGGTGITSAVSTTDKSVTLNFDGTFPAAHGTQYSLPLWTTATTLGDSQISQNSSASLVTISRKTRITDVLTVNQGNTKGIQIGISGNSQAHLNIGAFGGELSSITPRQGIHYSGNVQFNSTQKIAATIKDQSATSNFFGISCRVYITSGSFSNSGSATELRTSRIYDVACIPGQTPVWNKVIDQTTVGTLEVEFIAYTDGAATPKRGFTIEYTTNSATNTYVWTTIEMLGSYNHEIEFNT